MASMLKLILFLIIMAQADAIDRNMDGFLDQIYAESILNDIENSRPIKYDHVIVKGDLSLNNLKIINSSISIIDSQIQGELNFNRIAFNKSINFAGTCFNKMAIFTDSQFMDNTNFERTQFKENARFSRASFCKNVSFRQAKFDQNAYFTGTHFIEISDFCDVHFYGNVEFPNTQFNGDSYFNDVQFLANAKFKEANFTNSTYFRSTNFIGNADFSGANFNKNLDLTDLNFDNFNVEWKTIKNGLICDEVCYEVLYRKLIKNFEDLAQFEDADNCYYRCRLVVQSRKEWSNRSKYTDILAWLSCGYGTRPGYTLAWSFGVVFFFGLIFWAWNGIYRLPMPYQIWNISFATSVPFKDALYFSTLVFVSQAPPDWRPKEGWKYAVIIEDVLGWLLLALFLVTLANVMIR